MAKPITRIRTGHENSDDTSAVPQQDREGQPPVDLKELIRIFETLKESGLMDLLNGIMKNYQHTLNLVTDELYREKNQRFITNALTVYTLLSSIDTERLSNFMKNIASAFNDAEQAKEQGSLGVLSLLSEMKDRDVSAGVRILLNLMKGFTHEKKD